MPDGVLDSACENLLVGKVWKREKATYVIGEGKA